MTPPGATPITAHRAWLVAARRWLPVVPLVLAAVPPVLIVLAILHAGIEIPIADHWDMVPLIVRAFDGTLTFRDLWAQQNEHRYVVPWLMMLGLARVTRWNITAELLLNVGISLVSLGVLAPLIVRTCRPDARALAPWLGLTASMLTFSLVKWENWLWSLSQPAFFNALTACVLALVVTRYGPHATGVLLALLTAIVGVLSFANGLVLLVVIPLWLLIDPRAHARQRVALALATALAASVVTAVYLAGFQHPAKHPSPWLFLRQPVDFAGYVLVYLGAPLGWPSSEWSVAWGAAGLAAFAVGAAAIWACVPASRVAVLPWLVLVLYVIGSGAMVGIGRLGMGLGQALSSRYTTISTFFWVSVAVVVAVAASALLRTGRLSPRAKSAAAALLAVGVVASVGSYASVWLSAARWEVWLHETNRVVRECVRFHRGAPDACLRVLRFDTDTVRRGAEEMERLAVGPFAIEPPPPLSSFALVEPSQPAGAIVKAAALPIVVNFVNDARRSYRGLEIELAGWAMDPATRRAAAAVLIAADGVVVDRVPVTGGAQGHGDGSPLVWSTRFNTFRLPRDARVLEAYAVLDGRTIVRLLGAPTLEKLPRP